MHKGVSRSIVAFVVSALIGASGSALADPKAPTEGDRKLASDLVKKAIARSQAGDHESAIEIYLQAYTLVPNSLLLSNIGAEFQQSGMMKEALDYFCRYLQEDPSGTNAPYALSQAKILRRQLGKKKVDDADVCKPAEDRKTIRKRDPDEISDSRESKDGKDAKDAKDGKDGKQDGQGAVGTKGGKDPFKTEPERPNGNPTLMYAGLGAGIAGVAFTGLGVYYGIQAKDLSDQVSTHDEKKPWPADIRDIQARGERYERYQIGFMVAGGALAAAGVLMYVVGRPDGNAEHADKTTISVAPTTNGVTVFGRF